MIEFKNTRIPSTPEDWQLYTVSMKCGAAARSLTHSGAQEGHDEVPQAVQEHGRHSWHPLVSRPL
jgi:hypothetical protein